MANVQSIKVTPDVLRATSSNVSDIAGEYDQTVAQLYSKVEAMAAAWEGKDNLEYANQIRAFRPHLVRMKELMNEYAKFLCDAARAYDDVQGQIVTRAKNLVN